MCDRSENEGCFMATTAYRERVLQVCAESGNVKVCGATREPVHGVPVTVRRGPGGALGRVGHAAGPATGGVRGVVATGPGRGGCGHARSNVACRLTV